MIEVTELTKCFGSILAVDRLSFHVARGEVLGFLGPNGAGKSTTMKMLTCFLTPSSGTAKICGHDILTDSMAVRRTLGYLPESGALYGDMRVSDFLTFICRMRDLQEAQAAIDRVVELCALKSVYYQSIETLSKGYKRRVGLAQALIHDPAVLIMDEPTDGLDPNQKHDVRQLIRAMAKDKCIILSTHILEEVEAVCTRAMIIARGQLRADGSPDQLRKRAPDHGALRLDVEAPPDVNVAAALLTIPGVSDIQTLEANRRFVLLPANGNDLRDAALPALAAVGARVTNSEILEGKLDTCFRALTRN